MTSYYEILKVEPKASRAEIEAAVESQYNQWRRLVTHHDPKVVEEANRSLRTLEQIRDVLMDTNKRAVYDQSLNVGGLADPEALLRSAAPPPMSMPAPAAPASQVAHPQTPLQRVDAWVCPKCQTANAVGLQFCSKCGNQIGRACPSCSKMIEAIATFCAHCGREIAAILRQQGQAQIQELMRLIQEEQEQIQEFQKLNNQLFMFGGDKWGFYRDSVGCLTKSGIVSLFLVTFFVFAAVGGALGDGGVIFGMFIGFVVSILVTFWAQAQSIKPEVRRQIQVNMNRIVELEQEIKQIRATI